MRILKIDFEPGDVQRMNELAEKARRGSLTPPEKAAIDSYERVGHLLDLMHAKARQSLSQKSRARSRLVEEVTRHGTAAWTWLHAPREDKGLEFWRNRMLTLLPSAGGAEAVDSFPRSAWECRLRRSASFPIAGSPVGCDRHQRLGLRRIPHSFPRRAWERVSERRK